MALTGPRWHDSRALTVTAATAATDATAPTMMGDCLQSLRISASRSLPRRGRPLLGDELLAQLPRPGSPRASRRARRRRLCLLDRQDRLRAGHPGPGDRVTGLVTADEHPVALPPGADPFDRQRRLQEADTTGITRPATKHNYLVKDIDSLAGGRTRRSTSPPMAARGRWWSTCRKTF